MMSFSTGDTLRTIRKMAVSVIVMFALLGVASYLIAQNVHDKYSNGSLLFALMWIFSSIGLTIASGMMFGDLRSSLFGSNQLISKMLENQVLISSTWLVVSLFALMPCSYISNANYSGVDGPRLASMGVGFIAGQALGFFGLMGLFAKESWVGGTDAQRVTRLRNVA